MNQNKRSRVRAFLFGSVALALVSSSAVPVFTAAYAETTQPHAAVGLDQDGSFANIVEAVKPAVVTVTTRMNQPEMTPAQMPEGTPFDQFFRQFFDRNGPSGPGQMMPAPGNEPPATHALGSGFIANPDGLIVTNNHVVDGAKSIKVTLDDGRDFDATLVGTDPKTDLAVLRIQTDETLPSLEWGDSDHVQAGDRVIAIGNPFGIGTTVTGGIISALGRDLHSGPYDDFLQVDAALNHGNSGGPLIDTGGHVIGIDAAIFSPNDGNVGVGFAIPSNLAQKIVAEIEDTGTVERGYIGVQIQPVNDDIAAALGLGKAHGALIASVEPGTPGEAAGLLPGDVIVSLNNDNLEDAKDLSSRIADLSAGDVEHLGVWRGGELMDVKVTLAMMPGDVAAMGDVPGEGVRVPEVGLSVSSLTPQLRAQFGLESDQSGVVVTSVDPDVETGDLRPGDVIVSANSKDVATASDLESAIASARDDGRGAVLLLVVRDGNRAFVAVPFGQA